MAKDRLYFSHDYNARNDRKIAALVKKYKSSGYGVFWAVCEMMHEEGGELEYDNITIDALAKDLNEESDFVKSVIEDCLNGLQLFSMTGGKATSGRVLRNIKRKLEISEIRSNASKSRANDNHLSNNGQQNSYKERKKEIKKVNGISFFAKNTKVKLSDGSSQSLTKDQIDLIAMGELKPKDVFKRD